MGSSGATSSGATSGATIFSSGSGSAATFQKLVAVAVAPLYFEVAISEIPATPLPLL